MSDLTLVKRTDSVVPSSVNVPLVELEEMIKRVAMGGGGIRELIKDTIEQYGTMPIGAIYVQYPWKKAPSEMWPGTWKNITSTYANCFFRAEGDLSNNFNGDMQSDAIRNITGGFSLQQNCIGAGYGAFYSTWGNGYVHPSKRSTSNPTSQQLDFSRVMTVANEMRPYNHAIRIWERTE